MKTKTKTKTKTTAQKPAYKTTGALAAGVEVTMRWHMADLPQELHAVRASLLPFDDVIIGGSCGEDAAKYLDDPDAGRVPFFVVSTSDPQSQMNEYEFVVTAAGVTGELLMRDGQGGSECDVPFSISLRGLYEFLRQLPRPAHSFCD